MGLESDLVEGRFDWTRAKDDVLVCYWKTGNEQTEILKDWDSMCLGQKIGKSLHSMMVQI